MKKHKAGSWLMQIKDATFGSQVLWDGVQPKCIEGLQLQHYVMLQCWMGWTSLPALQVASAPAYLITIESHKDIYPVYYYSIQMPDDSSKFKGYHNLNKLSLPNDIPVAPLHTHTHS